MLATAWSAYVMATAILHGKKMTGESFVAAFLLPLGVVSAAALLFLPQYDLRFVLIAVHLLTTVCFLATYTFQKIRCGDPLLAPLEDTSRKDLLSQAYFSSVIYILYFVAIFTLRLTASCTIAKCHVMEILFGEKNNYYSVLYLGGFCGSILLSLITLILFRALLA